MPEATMAPPVVGTAPPGQSPYAYDVFMSYCPEDRGWVWDELQPRLEMAGLKCLDERDFEAGVPVLENIERALDSCCRTLVVLTPAWVENQWNHFESLLVNTRDVDARSHRLLPLMLKECRPGGRLAALTCICFTDLARREEAMARLLRQLGKSQQAVNEVVARSARKGLRALVELMQAPAVRDAMGFFESDFESAGKQIDVLSQYKHLHDCFQNVEGAYKLVLKDKDRLVEDRASWEDLENPALTLDAYVQSLLAYAGGTSLPPSELLWKGKLERAQKDLLAAIREERLDRFNSAAERLSAVIGQTPYKLNGCLVKVAEQLPLSRLVKQLRVVRHSMRDFAFEGEAAALLEDYGQGVDSLARLAESLTTYVTNHNCLQEIHNELGQYDLSSKLSPEVVRDAWCDLRGMVSSVSDASGGDWVLELRRLSAELDAAVAAPEAPKTLPSLFRKFDSQVQRGFYQVDRDLLTFCGQLQKVGETLGRGLQRMQHERD